MSQIKVANALVIKIGIKLLTNQRFLISSHYGFTLQSNDNGTGRSGTYYKTQLLIDFWHFCYTASR